MKATNTGGQANYISVRSSRRKALFEQQHRLAIMPPGPSADSLPGAICLALLVSFALAQSEFASLNSLCNQTFEEANAVSTDGNRLRRA